MTAKTPEQRSRIGRLGAHSLHAQGKTTTRRATAAMTARFDKEVDPDGKLTPEERAKRAEHAKSAYYTRLAMRRWAK